MLVGFLLLLPGLVLEPADTVAASRARCLACHATSDLTVADATLGTRKLSAVGAEVAAPWNAHSQLACTDCHANVAGPSAHGMVETEQPDPSGELEAALAKRCSKTRLAVLRACRGCHETEWKLYERSIHADSLVSGRDPGLAIGPAPTCVDCHGSHGIRYATDKLADTNLLNIPSTCARCHEAQGVLGTYQGSVHGQKQQLTGLDATVCVAVCTSCHSAHDILSPKDPDSTLALGTNRIRTCERCHPGANERFSRSFTHQDPSADPMIHWAELTHIAMTGLVAACMLLFMGSEAVRVIVCLVRRREPIRPAVSGGPAQYRRWSKVVRLQHILLVTSFATLSATGIPLMFPKAVTARFVIAAFGGVSSAALIHRIAAVGLMTAATFHITWVLACIRRGARWSPMIPCLKDVYDSVAMLKYSWGFANERPRMGRYAPPEKFEYWAAACGSVVMTVTGLLLWFPELGARVVGGSGIRLAQLMHGHEGILAVLVILIIHVCWVHFMPGFWPMSLVWLTGRIKRDAMEEYHAGEKHEIDTEAATEETEEPTAATAPAADGGDGDSDGDDAGGDASGGEACP